jgi:ribosomal protein L11 methyltransferase
VEFERIRVLVSDTAASERVSAEAFAAGAAGLEERSVEGPSGATAAELWIYAPRARAAAVRRAVEEIVARTAGDAVRWLGAEPAPEEDWSRSWREGLGVVRISPRLAVRPPFVPDDRGGGATLVIDPGQAFGTGGHASTRIALALLGELPDAQLRGARVLDVGTGSGVLALAALALGASTAVGLDLDPVAVREARRNADANGFGERARFFAGPIEALRGASFGLVLANLLRSEVQPLLPSIAAALRAGGLAVFSGLLASERAEVEAALGAAGLRICSEREEPDPSGDAWLGLVTRR